MMKNWLFLFSCLILNFSISAQQLIIHSNNLGNTSLNEVDVDSITFINPNVSAPTFSNFQIIDLGVNFCQFTVNFNTNGNTIQDVFGISNITGNPDLGDQSFGHVDWDKSTGIVTFKILLSTNQTKYVKLVSYLPVGANYFFSDEFQIEPLPFDPTPYLSLPMQLTSNYAHFPVYTSNYTNFGQSTHLGNIQMGVDYGFSPSQLDSSVQSTNNFSVVLENLQENSTYYIRPYSMFNSNVIYGDIKTFVTPSNIYVEGNGVIDIDGNNYPTVILGNQEWMAENLKVNTFNNGDPIVNTLDLAGWNTGGIPRWCDFNNDPANELIDGHLYNGIVVIDSRNVCPTDWHIPTDQEWQELEAYLGLDSEYLDVFNFNGNTRGSEQLIGIKLSDVSLYCTNESKFNLQYTGARSTTSLDNYAYQTNYWTSSPYAPLMSSALINRSIFGPSPNEIKRRFEYYIAGLAIRCVKD